jgi:hypothetical protein
MGAKRLPLCHVPIIRVTGRGCDTSHVAAAVSPG